MRGLRRDDRFDSAERTPSPSARLVAFLERQPRWRITVLGLAPDCLGLFSDGISEAPDGAEVEFGEPRLERLLRSGASLSAADLCERVFSEVQTYLRGRPSPDDLTIVVLKALGEGR